MSLTSAYQPSATDALTSGVYVPAGNDRFHDEGLLIWGLIPLAIKVSSKDTKGELLIFQHDGMGKGGPPRHIHFAQDEWFYVVAGEFAIEVGDEKFQAHPGDSLFAPRMIPHAWAHIGPGRGSLITTVSPAGSFEDFILETTRHPTLPTPAEIEQAFAAHDMKVVGPPLPLP